MIFVEFGSVEATAPEEPELFEAVLAAIRSVRAVAADAPLPRPIEVRFLSDDSVRSLNAEFRGVDAPTDVLSFPSEEENAPASIAIAIGVLRRQAELRRVSVPEEAAFLALHGALHIVGHDDEEPAALARMREETARYAARLGLPNVGEWDSIYKQEVVR